MTTHPGPIHGGARCCRPRPQRVGKGFPVSTLVKPPPPSRTRRRPLLPLPCARRLTHGCLLFFTLLFLAHGVSRTTASSTSRIAPKPPPLRRARRPTLPRTEQHTPLFLTQGGLLSSRTATSYSSHKAAEPRSLPRAQQFHFLAPASSSWLLLSSRTAYDLLSSRTASPDCVFSFLARFIRYCLRPPQHKVKKLLRKVEGNNFFLLVVYCLSISYLSGGLLNINWWSTELQQYEKNTKYTNTVLLICFFAWFIQISVGSEL